MLTLIRFFLFQRPFRHLKTPGLHLLLVGQGLTLSVAVWRYHVPAGPFFWVEWVLCGLATLAVSLLGLVVVAAALEYRRRPDRPRYPWQLPRLDL